MHRLAAIVIGLTMLLAGCGGSLRGNASAGPNPGGGFYSPSNPVGHEFSPRAVMTPGTAARPVYA